MFCAYFCPWTKWFRGCGWISWCHFGIKCVNHVRLSQIVAIRTTFCTNYFWNKSKHCVYLLFPTSIIIAFFVFVLFCFVLFFYSPCIFILIPKILFDKKKKEKKIFAFEFKALQTSSSVNRCRCQAIIMTIQTPGSKPTNLMTQNKYKYYN